MHTSHSGGIARCRVESTNEPPLCGGSIAVPCCESQTPDQIEIKLDATKVSSQAAAQCFDHGLLVRPPDKKCVPPGSSLQSSQDSAFRWCKIAFCYVHGLRQITHLLDVDANRVIEPQRKD